MSRRTRLATAALTLGLPLVAAACSLFVNTDGLSGDPSSASEGGAGNDGASSDGSVDDAGADARISDAGIDTGLPGPFCKSHPHTLCLDFDDSTAIPPNDGTNYDPTAFYVDRKDSVSPPNSLYTLWPAATGKNEDIDFRLTTTSGRLAGSVDVKLTSADLTAGQVIPLFINVPLTGGLSDHYFYLQTYYGYLNFAEAATPDDGGSIDYFSWTYASPVPNGRWIHLEFAVDGNTGVVTMSIDGASLPEVQAIAGFPAGDVNVSLGSYANDLPADVAQRLDNFALDL